MDAQTALALGMRIDVLTEHDLALRHSLRCAAGLSSKSPSSGDCAQGSSVDQRAAFERLLALVMAGLESGNSA